MSINTANYFKELECYNYVDVENRVLPLSKALKDVISSEEYKQYTGLLPKRGYKTPLQVQIELTNRCNLQCEFCYNFSGLSNRKELLFDDLLHVVQELIDMDVLVVIITGGEPFIDQERLFTVLDLLSRNNVSIYLLTNGWYITEQVVHRLMEYAIFSVQISIDGGSDIYHDKARGVKGSWKRAIEAVRLFTEHGFYTKVACIMTKENWVTLDDFIDLCFYLGAQEIDFTDIISYGRATTNFDSLKLDNDLYEECLGIIERKREQYKNLMLISMGVNTAFVLWSYILVQPNACQVCGDGTVIPHCLLPINMGNIKKEPLAKIWETQFSTRLIENKKIQNFVNKLDFMVTNRFNILRSL
ncbi:MAG: radical SAM/SPASM domain-containing protein [bacterium]